MTKWNHKYAQEVKVAPGMIFHTVNNMQIEKQSQDLWNNYGRLVVVPCNMESTWHTTWAKANSLETNTFS